MQRTRLCAIGVIAALLLPWNVGSGLAIPLTVIVLKIGDKHIVVDAGSGVGQWQANATHLPANMNAAGIDRSQISTILISHFHPDHVWGLMEKGTNAAVFPNAELIVNGTEYKWWTEPGRVEKLAEGRRAAVVGSSLTAVSIS
jgi:glyoxylase-like metal-dependent hydrolase (beta-lactamase superfamily II)